MEKSVWGVGCIKSFYKLRKIFIWLIYVYYTVQFVNMTIQ